jgi:O-antigen/teichoic acid export membrane protein
MYYTQFPVKFVQTIDALSSIKKLAKETLWYGLSTIVGRFLNYGLAFLHVQLFVAGDYGIISTLYASATFFNVLFTYGMETGYFRFIQTDKYKNDVFNTTYISLLVSTVCFTLLLLLFANPFAQFLEINKAQYVTWFAFILCFDTLSVIPFARLRQQGRPVKYALIKLANILITIALQLFFLWICPAIKKAHPDFDLFGLYDPTIGIGYVFIANLIASAFTLLLLWNEIVQIQWQFNSALWKDIMRYSLPLLIVGLGGMVNEALDRIMLPKLHSGGPRAGQTDNGIYAANYKLSILITLFIQAFRMGAEPFFFRQAKEENAQRTYARVMKFFVIICCVMFLVIVLFLNFWKLLITFKHAEYGRGIYVVPILALANLCLGIYYNLSIWYKLTNKTMTGAYITLAGAAITIVGNWIFIPIYSYWACAWTTLICYAFMMVISFTQGQKNYYIPYAWKKLLAYIVICLLLFGLHELIIHFAHSALLYYSTAIALLLAFIGFVFSIEKKEFQNLPMIGKYL